MANSALKLDLLTLYIDIIRSRSEKPEDGSIIDTKARYMLDKDSDDVEIESGLFSRDISVLAWLLATDSNPKIQLNLAKILSHASDNPTNRNIILVSEITIPILNLLPSRNKLVVKCAVHVLCNLSGSCRGLSAIVSGGITHLLERLVKSTDDSSILIEISVICKNICNEASLISSCAKPLIPCLVCLLQHDDSEIISAAAAGLRCISNIGVVFVDEIVDSGIVPRLIRIVRIYDSLIRWNVLGIFRSLIKGRNVHAQAVLQAGILSELVMLRGSDVSELAALCIARQDFMESSEGKNCSPLLWTSADILDCKLLPPLIEAVASDTKDIQVGAIIRIRNIFLTKNKSLIDQMLKDGVVDVLQKHHLYVEDIGRKYISETLELLNKNKSNKNKKLKRLKKVSKKKVKSVSAASIVQSGSVCDDLGQTSDSHVDQ